MDLQIRHFCPYGTAEDLEILNGFKNGNQFAQLIVKLNGVRKRLKTMVDLTNHRAKGHVPCSMDCPECRQGIGISRPHARIAERAGG